MSQFVTEPDPDGYWVDAKLTDEGVIVDVFDSEGEIVDSFARMYDEYIELATTVDNSS